MTLPIEQPSVSSIDLCSSPIPACTNSSSTPSKDSVNSNIYPSYDCKINWGKIEIYLKYKHNSMFL